MCRPRTSRPENPVGCPVKKNYLSHGIANHHAKGGVIDNGAENGLILLLLMQLTGQSAGVFQRLGNARFPGIEKNPRFSKFFGCLYGVGGSNDHITVGLRDLFLQLLGILVGQKGHRIP